MNVMFDINILSNDSDQTSQHQNGIKTFDLISDIISRIGNNNSIENITMINYGKHFCRLYISFHLQLYLYGVHSKMKSLMSNRMNLIFYF